MLPALYCTPGIAHKYGTRTAVVFNFCCTSKHKLGTDSEVEMRRRCSTTMIAREEQSIFPSQVKCLVAGIVHKEHNNISGDANRVLRLLHVSQTVRMSTVVVQQAFSVLKGLALLQRCRGLGFLWSASGFPRVCAWECWSDLWVALHRHAHGGTPPCRLTSRWQEDKTACRELQ